MKINTRPNYASNASIFANRGDPWATDKEGRANYGRNSETENPDYDCYTRADRSRIDSTKGALIVKRRPEKIGTMCQPNPRLAANKKIKVHHAIVRQERREMTAKTLRPKFDK